jgi:hypothetical protein
MNCSRFACPDLIRRRCGRNGRTHTTKVRAVTDDDVRHAGDAETAESHHSAELSSLKPGSRQTFVALL